MACQVLTLLTKLYSNLNLRFVAMVMENAGNDPNTLCLTKVVSTFVMAGRQTELFIWLIE
jgi:hypothetical protein